MNSAQKKEKLCFFAWIGGKQYMINHIYPFPQHTTFLDCFGGGGSVLLNKPPAKRDVYNDINPNLVNIFTNVRDNIEGFIRIAKIYCYFNSRCVYDYFLSLCDQFYKKIKEKKVFKADLETAVAFYYTQQNSFSGMGDYWSGMYSDKATSSTTHQVLLNRLNEDIIKISQRLQNVEILNKDFRDVLKEERFHNPDSLIYLDPPYAQGYDLYERNNKDMWRVRDLFEMIDMIKDTNAKVCISIDRDCKFLGLSGSKWNETPVVRKIFAGTQGEKPDFKEYVIRNYDQTEVVKQFQKTQDLIKISKFQ